MKKKIAIKGHPTRGKEVIELLEMMGGNTFNSCMEIAYSNRVYYIGNNNAITWDYIGHEEIDKYEIFTLEEFLEKYPFKVGDFVFAGNWSYAVDIRQMHWNPKTQEVEYMVKPGATELWYTANKLTKYAMPKFNVGETVYNKHTHEFGEIIKYQWQKTEYIYLISHPSEDAWYLERQLTNDVKPVDNENKMKNVLAELLEHIKTTSKEDLEKEFEELKEWSNVGPTVEEFMDFCNKVNKKPKYPTNYQECCDVLGLPMQNVLEYINKDCNKHHYYNDLQSTLNLFVSLKICRDAYWKIAGEQMGLGKPWEPDWTTSGQCRYTIETNYKKFIFSKTQYGHRVLLVFPTEEMRDAFYENFKDLIKSCKELL